MEGADRKCAAGERGVSRAAAGGAADPAAGRCPLLEADPRKLEHNLREIMARCRRQGIEVAGVVKGFTAWPELARVYERCGCPYIASSRIEQLQEIRAAGIQTPLMLLRVPMLSELEDVARTADLSLQSELPVLRALNEVLSARTAGRAPARHKVILMADLGDLREGFWDSRQLIGAAVEIERDLPCLELAGIGTNLTCFGSVKATPEKMQELLELSARVEKAIGRKLDHVCGGASSSLHMVMEETMPRGVNLLRLGESVLLGDFPGCPMDFTYKDVFTLKAEIIEVKDKPSYPVGELSADAFGRIRPYEDRGPRRRALAALGLADYGNYVDIRPRMAGVEVIGASSDHTVLDVEDAKERICVGDVLEFDINYASMVYLTNTRSVRRRLTGEP